jgi:membrane-bound lytic murein transglycosylase D
MSVREPEDPVTRLIANADAHLAAGISEIRDGHLIKAREAFDRAVDVYLTAPGGAYASPRLGEAYRRTVEAIHVRELESMVAGDGFTEKPAEPAVIDEVGELAVTEEPPSEETRRTTEEAVRDEIIDFPVVLNDSVLSCVDLYQGRLRDWMDAALARGGRYMGRIREIFAEEQIPQDLAYVALVESAFKTGALSRAKAKGVWQFMPSTGRHFGLQQNWWVDERSDPEKATRAAARYLKELYRMFDDWNLALASYNAGPGKVLRAISRYRTSDFWKLSKTRGLRRETRNYVPLIHAAIVVAKAPDKYGFDITPEAAPAFETVPVKGAYDLRVVSECAGTTLEAMQSLNPVLRRMATPANTTFQLKVPEGSGPRLTDCLAALPADKRVHFRTHVVARGQTLYTIAAKYGARTRDIADANGLRLTRRLAVGTELIIPIDPRTTAANVRRASKPTATASAAPAASGEGGAVRISYRIKPGDTLASIASQYGTTVRELQSWNRLRGSRIAAGDRLTIYTNRKF